MHKIVSVTLTSCDLFQSLYILYCCLWQCANLPTATPREGLDFQKSTRDFAKLRRTRRLFNILRELLVLCTKCQDRSGKMRRKPGRCDNLATGVEKVTIQQLVVTSRQPNVTSVDVLDTSRLPVVQSLPLKLVSEDSKSSDAEEYTVCIGFSRWPFSTILGGSSHRHSANFHGTRHGSFAVYHVCSNISSSLA